MNGLTDSEIALLDARARTLATVASAPAADASDFLVFRLAGQWYALPSVAAIEIVKLAHFARLPGAPSPDVGLTVWRGALIRVLDIRPLLGLATAALNDLTQVIVVHSNGAALGLLVDETDAIRSLTAAELLPPPEWIVRRTACVDRVTPDAVCVLSLERLLGSTSRRTHA